MGLDLGGSGFIPKERADWILGPHTSGKPLLTSYPHPPDRLSRLRPMWFPPSPSVPPSGSPGPCNRRVLGSFGPAPRAQTGRHRQPHSAPGWGPMALQMGTGLEPLSKVLNPGSPPSWPQNLPTPFTFLHPTPWQLQPGLVSLLFLQDHLSEGPYCP